MTSPDSTTKTCTKCDNQFPATPEYFYRDASKSDGMQSCCKPCQQTRNRHYYEANAEKERERVRQYREMNPDKVRDKDRRYRTANRDKVRASDHDYYTNNVEKVREQHWRYRIDNLDKERARWQRYKAANPEKNAVSSRNRRARVRNAKGTHTAADIAAQLKRQKGHCYWCNCKLEKYHVDHVHPIARGGWNDPSNLVIACPTCNDSKGAKLLHEWEGSGGRLL